MQNPINKVKQYAKNVDEQLGDWGNAGETYNKNKTSENKKKLQTERSEFFGALLQNRTYVDRKTGRAK